MPLIKSSSKAARQQNIRRLIDEGYPPMQAVAIAYSTQRAAKAKNRAGFSGEPYTVRTVGGGLRLYVSRIGNRAAAYSPHDGFTVFGMMDAGELRVAYGKKGKHYATPKTAEAAIRRWILEERRAGANMAIGHRRNRAGDPLAELVTALRNNADAYHERRLDHDAFARRNRYIWSQIEAMGEGAQDRALAMLRSRR